MDKKQLEQLISEMPLSDEQKKSLLADVASGLPAKVILEKIDTMMDTAESALDKANPDAAAAYDAPDAEYDAAVAKASGEFDTTMAQIDKEADEVGKEMLKKLDDARLEELRDGLKTAPQPQA